MYEETQRQLQITVDQYGVAQRRLQALQSELEEMRANMEAVSYFFFFKERSIEKTCILK
jgi:hypothetical protein